MLFEGAVGIVREGLSSDAILKLPKSSDSALRKHYIVAEEYTWDYTPDGKLRVFLLFVVNDFFVLRDK